MVSPKKIRLETKSARATNKKVRDSEKTVQKTVQSKLTTRNGKVTLKSLPQKSTPRPAKDGTPKKVPKRVEPTPKKISPVSPYPIHRRLSKNFSASPVLSQESVFNVSSAESTPQKCSPNDGLSPFKASKKNLFGSPSRRKSPRKASKKKKSFGYYNRALDNILSEMEDQKERDKKLKQIERQILETTFSDRPSLPQSFECEDDIAEMKLMPKNRTQSDPPGLKILEPAHCFRYFSSVEDIVGSDSYFEMPVGFRSVYLEKLSGLPADFLPELIERGGLLQYSLAVNPAPGVLIFLLRLMAVHASKSVVASCKKTIEYYLTACREDFRWCPSLGDVISLVLNYGSGVRSHCPLKEEFVDKEKEISRLWSPRKKAQRYQQIEPSLHICGCKHKHVKIVNYHNFKSVVETLGFCIWKCNVYCATHLSQLITLLCWLSLDNLLLSQQVGASIQECLGHAVLAFAEDDWQAELVYLSKELASIGESHHHNILHVIRMLPPSRRGVQLQQSTAFTAIQILMKKDTEPAVVARVTPKDVLKFLRRNSLHQNKDSYFLYSIVSMIDIAVGHGVSSHKAVVQAISDVLMKLFSRTSDSMFLVEQTQLKNLIVTLRSKWFFITQGLHVAEKKPTTPKVKSKSAKTKVKSRS